MKLFYNPDGSVAGSVDAISQSIEEAMIMPNTQSISAPEDIAKRIRDSNDPLEPHLITVVDGRVILPSDDALAAADAERLANQRNWKNDMDNLVKQTQLKNKPIQK